MSLFNSPQPQRYEYPILGVRGWEIKSNRLVAISDKSFVWQPGSNKARCNSYSNSCPCEMNILTAFQNHHCGFNASYGYNRYIINEGIVGVIAGAGKVQLHANGFRSEYAQVLGLLHPDPERNINFRSSFEKRLKIKLYQIQNKKYEQLAAYYRVPLFSSGKTFMSLRLNIPLLLRSAEIKQSILANEPISFMICLADFNSVVN